MGFWSKQTDAIPLKPYVFRFRESLLIGLGPDPKVASPCSGCVERWLQHRNITVENASIMDLKSSTVLLAELFASHSTHILYEVPHVGKPIRLECAIFPHPECACHKGTFIAPTQLDERTNFTFSPIVHLKNVRYGTPLGNLWLATASGRSEATGTVFSGHGMAREKGDARWGAVETWLKKNAKARIRLPSEIEGTNFMTGHLESMRRDDLITAINEVGIGPNETVAMLDAFYSLSKLKTLGQFSAENRKPMLIVGASSWLRDRFPWFLHQTYDLYPLFYPNPMPTWVVGFAAISRVHADERPLFSFASHPNMDVAIDKAIGALLEYSSPSAPTILESTEPRSEKNKKLNLWWTHWIYRCPKINLKDLLHLDAHPKEIDIWKDYLKERNETFLVTPGNEAGYPSAIRHLVHVFHPTSAVDVPQKVHGIGSVSHYRNVLDFRLGKREF